jgi:hypothetical protein
MLGNNGSTPLELFRDQLMVMEDAYRVSRRAVMDIVKVLIQLMQTKNLPVDAKHYIRRVP